MIYGCYYRRGMDWKLDLLTPLGTASNYSAIADLHSIKTIRISLSLH
jgi:hypothetical protein